MRQPYLPDNGESFRRALLSNFSEEELKADRILSPIEYDGINWTRLSNALSRKFNLPQEACDNAIVGR